MPARAPFDWHADGTAGESTTDALWSRGVTLESGHGITLARARSARPGEFEPVNMTAPQDDVATVVRTGLVESLGQPLLLT
jgi:hypothetical protein